jgi:mono/diheme cytochrome c family protein/glucose/arabinose dehydrogenase
MNHWMIGFCCLSWPLISGIGLLAEEPENGPAPRAHLTNPLSPALSPEEQWKRFEIAAGYRIELVACEPMVQDPVAMTFDEEGRLWVVEMRGFMPDIEGRGEEAPVGRISILEDVDGDGRMDRSTVFLDGLVLPRALAVVRGGALVAENKPLWFVEDGDGGGAAAGRRLVDEEYGGTGLPEHSANGLWRGLDNWHYNAKSKFRYRFLNGDWVREETEFRGQWGICHDDFGRLFYNYNWSQLHADLAPPNYLSRNPHHSPSSGISVGVSTNQAIYPIRMNTAVNRGYIPGALDDRGRLQEFTAAGAPWVYRGDLLPELRGNVFVCEPAGNLVKRNVIEDHGLELRSRFAHEKSEFLASTDERFRPVWLAGGPDGAIYIADMYRGLIQHAAHITPYLKEETVARGLDRPVHWGRIWRIVPEHWKSAAPMKLSRASSSQLVGMLAHENGWHRDTAQRLLVERGDASVRARARQLALEGADPLGRLHALWTLEGWHDPEPGKLFPALGDPHPQVQAAAIRVIERLSVGDSEKEEKLISELRGLMPSAPVEARLQAALSAGNLGGEGCLELLLEVITEHADMGLMRDGVMSSLRDREWEFFEQLWREPDWQRDQPGRAIFLEMLAGAITRAGRSEPIMGLLAKLDLPSEEQGWREGALLAGMATRADERRFKRIPLESAPAVLANLEQAPDARAGRRWEKLLALFEWPGRIAEDWIPTDVRPLTELEQQRFALGRQHYLAVCAGCHGSDGEGLMPLGPPLVDAEWVLGSEERLIRILLHGMEGPVDVGGKRYAAPEILPDMPALAVLDNESIASVLTYIRREWGHGADPVNPLSVSRIRVITQGRGRPWTQEELLGEN